jgi:hypothetical protein
VPELQRKSVAGQVRGVAVGKALDVLGTKRSSLFLGVCVLFLLLLLGLMSLLLRGLMSALA